MIAKAVPLLIIERALEIMGHAALLPRNGAGMRAPSWGFLCANMNPAHYWNALLESDLVVH